MKTRFSGDARTPLSPEEKERYRRQLILPEIGEDGQRRLKGARVCVVGLGGLGSISATVLAASGVGTLRVVDRDRVETGNLNRQIAHWTADVGRPKTDSAREKLLALNPGIRVDAVQMDVNRENAAEAVGDCALILDATDNLAVRKALNRVAVAGRIPFVCGGVEGFSGMVTTVAPGAPCLECLFPGEAAEGEREIGVPGPMPGVVASLQALEAIKLILGIGRPLTGRMILIRALDMTFREVRVDERNPHCPVCGGPAGEAI